MASARTLTGSTGLILLVDWINSYLGMFVVQALLHSVATLLVVETAIVVFELKSHLERFRYRLLSMFLPLCMFPGFQILIPERGSFYFRQDHALFDSLRWLRLEFMGIPIILAILATIMGLSSLVTLFQEILPFIRARSRGQETVEPSPSPYMEGLVAELAEAMKVARPQVKVLEDEHPVIYTLGARKPTVVISDSLLNTLDEAQLRSAIAHELAHIKRQSNATTFLVYLARLIMFFSPVSLLVFRRIIQDDEHICDDITATLTGDPEKLATTLRVFTADVAPTHTGVEELKEALGDHSHNLLLLERISRLEEGNIAEDMQFRALQFAMTLVGVLIINYFLV